MKTIYLLMILVCPFVAFAQPLGSYNAKVGGGSFNVSGQLPTGTGCLGSGGGTQYGFRNGGTDTYGGGLNNCGGSNCVFTGSSSFSVSPGTDGTSQSFGYISRSYSYSNCSLSLGGSSVQYSWFVNSYNDLALSGTPFPTTVCSTGSALSLPNYISINAAVSGSIVYKLDGVVITSSLNPSTVSVGSHTLTATMAWANATTVVTIGTFNLYTTLSGVTNPSNTSVCGNGNASFTTSGSGSGVTYQWQESTNGGSSWSSLTSTGIYSGATSVTLTLTSPGTGRDNYQYRCLVNDAGSCNPTTTSAATLRVFGQVAVVTSPSSVSICPSSNTSFSASGTANSGSMTYQWQVSSNGGVSFTNLSNSGIYTGATTSTLTLTSATSAVNSFRYQCVLTDACGAINSNTTSSATLTIYGNVNVLAQPTDKSICGTGGSTTFTTSATGPNGTLTYQWQLSTNNGVSYSNLSNGGNYSGVTTNTLSVSSLVTTLNNNKYRCIIQDACTTGTQAVTNEVLLNVYGVLLISSQPSNTTVCRNSGATFSVTSAAQNGSLSYQWQESTNGGSTWADIANAGIYSGANAATLNLSSASASFDGYRYRVKVSDACAAVTQTISNSATLNLYAVVAITSPPPNRLICPNTNTTFTVGATSSNGALSYQWQQSTNGGTTWANLTNTGVYTGVTTSTLTLTTAPNTMNNYRFRCAVQDACGSVNQTITGDGILTFNTVVSISAQPTNQTGCAAGNTSFSVTAAGTGIGYQWQESTNGGTTWTNISNTGVYSGATTATLTLTGITFSFSNFQYRSVVSGTCGNINSNAGVLSVTVAPSITADPTGSTVCQTSPVTFSLTATGSSLTYQWEYSTTGGAGTFANISGATSSTYSIASTISANAGYYRAKVSNSCLTTTSGSAQLIVNANTSISTQPINKTVCPGSSTTFTVVGAGTGTITYQWQESTNGGTTYTNISNGGVYSGATTSSLSLSSITLGMTTYRYRSVVHSNCGSDVNSTGAVLTVNAIPGAPTAPSVARCGDGSLSAIATSPAGSPTFNWYNNDTDIVGVFTGATYTISSLSSTQTKYVSVTSGGCESSKTAVVYTRNAPQSVPLGSAINLCVAQGNYNLEADITDPVAVGSNFTWTANSTNFSSKMFDPTVGEGAYTVSYDPPASAKATPYCYTATTRTVNVLASSGEGGLTFTGTEISGGNTVNTCVGNAPITISSFPSTTGGTWSTVSGSGISSSGTATVFTPTSSNYTATTPNIFRYTVTIGGCSASKDLTVYVKDNTNAPVISGVANIICPGTEITATAAVSAAGTFTYEWYKSGTPTTFATGASLTYPVTNSETFEVRSLNTFGCRSNATFVAINTPFASGVIGLDKNVINVSDKISFNYNVSTAGNSYRWSFGDGGVSTEKNPIHYFYKPGDFQISLVVTSTLGCSQTLTYGPVKVQGDPIDIITGSDDPLTAIKEVIAYPLPFENVLSLQSEMNIGKTKMELVNMMGGVFIQKEINIHSGSNEIISHSESGLIPPGLYILRLKTEKLSQTIKVIKK